MIQIINIIVLITLLLTLIALGVLIFISLKKDKKEENLKKEIERLNDELKIKEEEIDLLYINHPFDHDTKYFDLFRILDNYLDNSKRNNTELSSALRHQMRFYTDNCYSVGQAEHVLSTFNIEILKSDVNIGAFDNNSLIIYTLDKLTNNKLDNEIESIKINITSLDSVKLSEYGYKRANGDYSFAGRDRDLEECATRLFNIIITNISAKKPLETITNSDIIDFTEYVKENDAEILSKYFDLTIWPTNLIEWKYMVVNLVRHMLT